MISQADPLRMCQAADRLQP